MPEKLKKENPVQKNTRKRRENLLKASRKNENKMRYISMPEHLKYRCR